MQDHPPTNCAYRAREVRRMGGFVHRTSLFRRLSAFGVRPVRFDPAMRVTSATDSEPLPLASLGRFAMMSHAVNVHFYDYRKTVRVAMILASPIHFVTHLGRILSQATRERTADRTFILGLPGLIAGSAIYEVGAVVGLVRPRRYVERMLARMQIEPDRPATYQPWSDPFDPPAREAVKQA